MGERKLMKYLSTAAAVLVGAMAFAPVSAHASTATANIAVSATVAKDCSATATPLAFGSYSGTAITNTTATIGVTCTNSTTYTVSLSTGAGTYATRTMTNGAATLNYQLYTTAGDTTIFGDNNSDSTSNDGGTGNGTSQSYTVYGVVPASQFPTPGSYNDSITVTVTY